MIASQARSLAKYARRAVVIGTPEWFETEIEKRSRAGETQLFCHSEYILPHKDALEVAGFEIFISKNGSGKVSWK